MKDFADAKDRNLLVDGELWSLGIAYLYPVAGMVAHPGDQIPFRQADVRCEGPRPPIVTLTLVSLDEYLSDEVMARKIREALERRAD